MQKICILGAGYVGLVSAACLAKTGQQVINVDINDTLVKNLQNGLVPFYEPGLKDLIREELSSGRLTFSSNISDSIQNSNIIIIAVGTPSGNDGSADISQVLNAATIIAQNLNKDKIVVVKSTVPPGTCMKVDKIINEEKNKKFNHYIVSNPEFLREGSAIEDTLSMERAIVGSESPYASKIIAHLHEPFTTVVVETDLHTSELIKYASNSFLAVKISFINEFSRLCEAFNADVKTLAYGMGLDPRIGKDFLKAGVGFGGSCFPKDTKALLKIADEIGQDMHIVRSAIIANDKQRSLLLAKIYKKLPDVRKRKIAILGLSFKPKTDDIREAPALTVIENLLHNMADIHVYDPVALENGKRLLGNQVTFENNPYQAIQSADAIIIMTEWEEIINLDYRKIFRLMNQPIIIDGRNCLNKDELSIIGFDYQGIGLREDNNIKEEHSKNLTKVG